MNTRIKEKGFTLIELLVVIAIIALLLSIMMPGLRRAKYMAQRIIGTNNAKGQTNVQNSYASDWNGKFVTHEDPVPNYVRTPDAVVEPGSTKKYYAAIYRELQGPYLSDGEIFECPLLRKVADTGPGAWRGFISDRFWCQESMISGWWYGGWDATYNGASDKSLSKYDEPEKSVRGTGYNWYAGFKPCGIPTNPDYIGWQPIMMESGERRWPMTQADCSAVNVVITHTAVAHGTDSSLNDYLHKGKGPNTPIDIAFTDKKTDNPIGYGDGHVEFRKKNTVKLRATYDKDSKNGQELTYVYY